MKHKVAGKTAFSRKLRNNPTDAESKLWRFLKRKQVDGLKFRRQQPIGPYIVDFVCFEKRLIVEVDGGQHEVEKAKDRQRDACLNSEGFKVMRFWNNDVLLKTSAVMESLWNEVTSSPSPSSPPLEGGENVSLSCLLKTVTKMNRHKEQRWGIVGKEKL